MKDKRGPHRGDGGTGLPGSTFHFCVQLMEINRARRRDSGRGLNLTRPWSGMSLTRSLTHTYTYTHTLTAVAEITNFMCMVLVSVCGCAVVCVVGDRWLYMEVLTGRVTDHLTSVFRCLLLMRPPSFQSARLTHWPVSSALADST